MKASSSSLRKKLLSYLFLISIQLHQCDAEESPETFFLQCPADGNRETISNDNVTRNKSIEITVARPGDRIILDYQSPRIVSFYPTEDCTLFNESLPLNSHLAENEHKGEADDHHHQTTDNLFIMENQTQRDWYQFQIEDVTNTFTFVCHDEGADVGCDTMDHKFRVQVQTIPSDASSSNQEDDINDTDASPPSRNQPRKPSRFRSRSRPIENDFQEGFDYGLTFLSVLGSLGLIALIINCCVEYKEMVVKEEADRIACEMNAGNS